MYHLTPEELSYVISLIILDKTADEIATLTGRSRVAIYDIIKKHFPHKVSTRIKSRQPSDVTDDEAVSIYRDISLKRKTLTEAGKSSFLSLTKLREVVKRGKVLATKRTESSHGRRQ